MQEYNLIDKPWIPLLNKDGTLVRLSLSDALVHAHDYEGVYHDSPLVIFAVYRLLLAIVLRVFAPKSIAEWEILWCEKQFSQDAISDYLSKWHHRFNLTDEERPFYQVSTHPAGDEISSINKIVLSRSAGNNPVYHDHSNDLTSNPLRPEDAIVHLLAYQAFSPGGGKSKTINFQHSPLTAPLTVLVSGGNLFQTLLLNTLWSSPIPDSGYDKPFWEGDGKIIPEPKTKYAGLLDYLTLQSRVVKILFKETDSGLVAEGVQLAQGRGLDPDILEPFAKYFTSKKEGFLPVRVSVDKLLWREYHQLTCQNTKESERFPRNIEQTAKLEKKKIIPIGTACRILCGGMASDKAKILLWRYDRLPLPLPLLEDTDIMNSVEALIAEASQKAKTLWIRSIKAIEQVLSDKAKNADSKAVNQLYTSLSTEALFWAQLEIAFKGLLSTISRQPDKTEEASIRWRHECNDAFKNCWTRFESSIINYPRGAEAIVKAVTDNNNMEE